MNNVICETPRLILRKIDENDFENLRGVLSDSEVMRFSIHGAEGDEGIRKFLAGSKKRYETDGVAQWAVIRKEDQVFVGTCGISVKTIDSVKEFEIGYRLVRKFWGNGYASEAEDEA